METDGGVVAWMDVGWSPVGRHMGGQGAGESEEAGGYDGIGEGGGAHWAIGRAGGGKGHGGCGIVLPAVVSSERQRCVFSCLGGLFFFICLHTQRYRFGFFGSFFRLGI